VLLTLSEMNQVLVDMKNGWKKIY